MYLPRLSFALSQSVHRFAKDAAHGQAAFFCEFLQKRILLLRQARRDADALFARQRRRMVCFRVCGWGCRWIEIRGELSEFCFGELLGHFFLSPPKTTYSSFVNAA